MRLPIIAALLLLTGCSLSYWTGSVEKTRISTDELYASRCEGKAGPDGCADLYEARRRALEDIKVARGTPGASPLYAKGNSSDLITALKNDRQDIRAAKKKVIDAR